MIEKKLLHKVLEKALSNGADFAELFVENTYNSTLNFNSQKTKQIVAGIDFGVGVRVFYGNMAIYAYTNEVTEAALMKAAEAVCKAYQANKSEQVLDLTKKDIKDLHKISEKNADVPMQERIDLVRQIDTYSRNYDALISQVDINMIEKNQNILIVNSEGLWIEDERNYSRLYVSSIATNGKEKQTGTEGPGGHAGFEFFRSINPRELGEETAKRAVTMLKAKYAPSGKFPVVIDNGFGGVIFHEACGHSLEATSVAKNASVFAGKMGEKIASSVVTAIDDGTIPHKWGSTNIDDEGNPTQRTVLIQDGILSSFMIDKLGGIKMGMNSTGSGRRQSYKYAPTSRMRNTYIAPGENSLEELLSSIDYGIYAKKMGGGSVMPGTGDFNFSVAEGYIIKQGKISEAIRGATLIGNGAESIKKISMVADNLELAEGMCGSQSGSIPTCVGQPAIKIDEILVGGRKEA